MGPLWRAASATGAGLAEPGQLPRSRWIGWGLNGAGPLSQGFRGGDQCLPVLARGGLEGIVQIETGSGVSIARCADGTVWDCGSNMFNDLGRLGHTSPPRAWMWTFGQVLKLDAGGTSATAVSIAGLESGGAALMSDGTIKVWGLNTSGELGNGPEHIHTEFAEKCGGQYPIPMRHSNGELITGVVEIASWSGGLMYRKANGSIWLSGSLHSGARYAWPTMLFDATAFPARVVQIAPRFYFLAFLLADGSVRTMGNNQYGELGIGKVSEGLPPGGPFALHTPTLGPVKALALCEQTAAALVDHQVYTWGRNDEGQLGIGTSGPESQPTPMPVPGLTGVTAISAGTAFVGEGEQGGDTFMCLLSDGTLRGWGRNEHGQLADGTLRPRPSPVPSAAGYKCRAISQGGIQCWAHLTEDLPLGPPQLAYDVSPGQITVRWVADHDQPFQVRWRPFGNLYGWQTVWVPKSSREFTITGYTQAAAPFAGHPYVVAVKGSPAGSEPGAYAEQKIEATP
jgi:alpha-tubulin suppressor-like RCC1 family protein